MKREMEGYGGGRRPRPAWYQRLHAWLLSGASLVYDAAVDERKRALLGELQGTVLEIGPGTGANLRYYASDVRWIGIDPNPYMHTYLREEADRLGLVVDLRVGTAESLGLPDESVDAVVSTLVLCSVDNQARTLGEIVRVLRPGGRFVFMEHVAAPRGTWLRRTQGLVRPLWQLAADGCRLDRESWKGIEAAGFSNVSLEHFDTPFPLVRPHIAGVATK